MSQFKIGDKVGLGKDKATIIGPSVIYGPGYWYIEFDDGTRGHVTEVGLIQEEPVLQYEDIKAGDRIKHPVYPGLYSIIRRDVDPLGRLVAYLEHDHPGIHSKSLIYFPAEGWSLVKDTTPQVSECTCDMFWLARWGHKPKCQYRSNT